LARPLYRTRQVFHALFPRVSEVDIAAAESLLSEPQRALFRGIEKRDKRHAIEVMRRLGAAGVSDPDLLVAALLHDCGKGSAAVWLRVLHVLAPALVVRLGRADHQGWRGAAHRLANHVERSVRMAEAAGATAVTLRLISGTVESSECEKLQLLRSADDAS
jgi:hypothetical protein